MKIWRKAAIHKEDVHMEDEEDDDDENLTEQLAPARKRKRRSCADPIQYLVEKKARENELRKEELEVRRQELQLKAEQLFRMFELHLVITYSKICHFTYINNVHICLGLPSSTFLYVKTFSSSKYELIVGGSI